MQNIDLICIGKMNAKYFAEGVACLLYTSTLQIADLMNDTRTLHAAQAEAAALLAADPLLEAPEHSLLAAQVEQMFTKAGAMTLQFLLPPQLKGDYVAYNALQKSQGFDLEPCCGKHDFTPIRKFNLMFKTAIGVTEDSSSTCYLLSLIHI